MPLRPASSPLFPYTTLFRSVFDLLVREGDLRGRRVLEVGCGTGQLAAALAERAYAKVWAVDASPEMLAVAREDRKSTRLNSSHITISYADFCLKKKKNKKRA